MGKGEDLAIDKKIEGDDFQKILVENNLKGLFFEEEVLKFNLVLDYEVIDNCFVIKKMYLGRFCCKDCVPKGELKLVRAIGRSGIVLMSRIARNPEEMESLFIYQELYNLLSVEKITKGLPFSFDKDWNIQLRRKEDDW